MFRHLSLKEMGLLPGLGSLNLSKGYQVLKEMKKKSFSYGLGQILSMKPIKIGNRKAIQGHSLG